MMYRYLISKMWCCQGTSASRSYDHSGSIESFIPEVPSLVYWSCGIGLLLIDPMWNWMSEGFVIRMCWMRTSRDNCRSSCHHLFTIFLGALSKQKSDDHSTCDAAYEVGNFKVTDEKGMFMLLTYPDDLTRFTSSAVCNIDSGGFLSREIVI